ncbi:MAG TPA: hypothetical protein VFW33_07425 [Gemmataceae bacterium]|nr:hypothetical protein [Gemmataceae bacterium]
MMTEPVCLEGAMNRDPQWTEQRNFERNRNRSFAEKWVRIGEIKYMARVCHAAAVRLANPSATARDVHRAWLLFTLGEKLVNEIEAAGHDLYRAIPDEPIVVEGRADEPRVAGPSAGEFPDERHQGGTSGDEHRYW